MKPYQEEYLELLQRMSNRAPLTDVSGPEQFVSAVREINHATEEAVRRGSDLLRDNLFPVLDNILSASQEDLDDLFAFSNALLNPSCMDAALNNTIHQALLTYARHVGSRDMLIRELYCAGMALFWLERPDTNHALLYSARCRMYFTECASHFETDYDDITDPEIRGYIHRSMANIAITYSSTLPSVAQTKLALIDRSLRILSDPDIQAKTPSLPWETFIYKSHQERTTLLSFLRSGLAGPDAFAQVLESAQIVQARQLKAMREKDIPLEPRWQYSLKAAEYHSGALQLEDFLDSLYGLSTVCSDTDYSANSIFCHLSVPAIYSAYLDSVSDPRSKAQLAKVFLSMTQRMFRWISSLSHGMFSATLPFYVRQYIMAYNEFPACPPFFDILQDLNAIQQPALYIRGWIAGQIARQLTDWAVEDCPEKLVGLPNCPKVDDVIWNRPELLDYAERACRLSDAGLLELMGLESLSCRGLLKEEEALLQLHPVFGAELLERNASTKEYADVARGHSCWYNERGGYPLDMSPSSSPYAPMIYLVAAADTLSDATEEGASRYRPVRPFQDCLSDILAGSGTRFAPFVSNLLRSQARQQQLQENLSRWGLEAYQALFRRRADAMALGNA